MSEVQQKYVPHGLHQTGGSEASGSPWSGIEHNGKMDFEIRTNRSHRKTCNRFIQKDTLILYLQKNRHNRYNRIVIGYRCATDVPTMCQYQPVKNPS